MGYVGRFAFRHSEHGTQLEQMVKLRSNLFQRIIFKIFILKSLVRRLLETSVRISTIFNGFLVLKLFHLHGSLFVWVVAIEKGLTEVDVMELNIDQFELVDPHVIVLFAQLQNVFIGPGVIVERVNTIEVFSSVIALDLRDSTRGKKIFLPFLLLVLVLDHLNGPLLVGFVIAVHRPQCRKLLLPFNF